MKNQELINDYLDYLKYERKLSDNTYDSYAQNLKNLLEHFHGKSLITLSKDDIRSFLYDMPKSAKTKAHYLTVINSFYNYLIVIGKMEINPCGSIKMPKLEKKLPNYLTIEEVDRLLDINCKTPPEFRTCKIKKSPFSLVFTRLYSDFYFV